MVWMNDAFKTDKRFLSLQLKRGKMKRRDIDAILSKLPDVSSKGEWVNFGENAPSVSPQESTPKPTQQKE